MTGAQPAHFPRLPLRFLFVRHGESFSNLDRAHNLEIPNENIQLTPRGWQQAHGCGQFLREYLSTLPGLLAISFAHSSYTRARQTAQEIYDAIMPLPAPARLKVAELDLLAEHHVGYLHGMTDEAIAEQYPYINQRYELHRTKGSHQFAPYYGGEMRAAVGHRATTFLELAYQQHAMHGVDTFIVISHGRLMQQFAKILNGLPRETIDAGDTVGNCDVQLFQRHGDQNAEFGDFGSIYQNGEAQPPTLQHYENAGERLARGAYRQDR